MRISQLTNSEFSFRRRALPARPLRSNDQPRCRTGDRRHSADAVSVVGIVVIRHRVGSGRNRERFARRGLFVVAGKPPRPPRRRRRGTVTIEAIGRIGCGQPRGGLARRAGVFHRGFRLRRDVGLPEQRRRAPPGGGSGTARSLAAPRQSRQSHTRQPYDPVASAHDCFFPAGQLQIGLQRHRPPQGRYLALSGHRVKPGFMQACNRVRGVVSRGSARERRPALQTGAGALAKPNCRR